MTWFSSLSWQRSAPCLHLIPPWSGTFLGRVPPRIPGPRGPARWSPALKSLRSATPHGWSSKYHCGTFHSQIDVESRAFMLGVAQISKRCGLGESFLPRRDLRLRLRDDHGPIYLLKAIIIELTAIPSHHRHTTPAQRHASKNQHFGLFELCLVNLSGGEFAFR
jgi:hypothetical protein